MTHQVGSNPFSQASLYPAYPTNDVQDSEAPASDGTNESPKVVLTWAREHDCRHASRTPTNQSEAELSFLCSAPVAKLYQALLRNRIEGDSNVSKEEIEKLFNDIGDWYKRKIKRDVYHCSNPGQFKLLQVCYTAIDLDKSPDKEKSRELFKHGAGEPKSEISTIPPSKEFEDLWSNKDQFISCLKAAVIEYYSSRLPEGARSSVRESLTGNASFNRATRHIEADDFANNIPRFCQVMHESEAHLGLDETQSKEKSDFEESFSIGRKELEVNHRQERFELEQSHKAPSSLPVAKIREAVDAENSSLIQRQLAQRSTFEEIFRREEEELESKHLQERLDLQERLRFPCSTPVAKFYEVITRGVRGEILQEFAHISSWYQERILAETHCSSGSLAELYHEGDELRECLQLVMKKVIISKYESLSTEAQKHVHLAILGDEGGRFEKTVLIELLMQDVPLFAEAIQNAEKTQQKT